MTQKTQKVSKLLLTCDVDDIRLFKSKHGKLHEFFEQHNIKGLKVDIELPNESIVTIRLASPSNLKLLRASELMYKHMFDWYGSLRRGDLETVEYLLQHFDIDVNLPVKDHVTPLMIACGHGGFDNNNKVIPIQPNGHIVSLLLKYNADSTREDMHGNTAYSIANDRKLYGVAMLVKPTQKPSMGLSISSSEAKDSTLDKKRRHSVSVTLGSVCSPIQPYHSDVNKTKDPKHKLTTAKSQILSKDKHLLKKNDLKKVSRATTSAKNLKVNVPTLTSDNNSSGGTKLNHSLTALITLSPTSLGLAQYDFSNTTNNENSDNTNKNINENTNENTDNNQIPNVEKNTKSNHINTLSNIEEETIKETIDPDHFNSENNLPSDSNNAIQPATPIQIAGETN